MSDMNIQPVRFGPFTWPNNPERYSSSFARAVTARKITDGGFSSHDAGQSQRTHTMSGCFFGPAAFDTYLRLEELFREGGARALIHPHWPPCTAFMTALTLTQEPLENYVGYSVTFLEEGEKTALEAPPAPSPAPAAAQAGAEGSAVKSERRPQYLVHVVIKGDTLWGISKKYNVELSTIIALNPQIKNPNLIYAGDIVRVREL